MKALPRRTAWEYFNASWKCVKAHSTISILPHVNGVSLTILSRWIFFCSVTPIIALSTFCNHKTCFSSLGSNCVIAEAIYIYSLTYSLYCNLDFPCIIKYPPLHLSLVPLGELITKCRNRTRDNKNIVFPSQVS